MAHVQLVFRGGKDVLKAFIPEALFDAIRRRAKSEGMPYKRFIRQVLERETTERKRLTRKAKSA